MDMVTFRVTCDQFIAQLTHVAGQRAAAAERGQQRAAGGGGAGGAPAAGGAHPVRRVLWVSFLE